MKEIEQKEWGIKFSQYFCVPQRYILATMACCGIICGFLMRVCLSIVMTQLVLPINKTASSPSEVCPISNETITEGANKGHIAWNEETQAIIFSSFYLGYVTTHVPAGILADKFGAKWVMGLGVLIITISTFLCPVAINNESSYGLIILRVCKGFGSGPMFPATSVLLSHWIPLTHRSKVGTVVLGGCQFGTVLANGLSGVLLQYYHWSLVFYLFASISVFWFINYVLFCYSDPVTHPFIKPSEREYLLKELVSIDRGGLPPLPLKAIFSCASTYALLIGQIGHDWGYYIMVTYLPKYLNDVLNINVADNGFFSAMPYLVMYFISILSGVITDYLLDHNKVDITLIRKINTFLGAAGPAIFFLGASYAGCNKDLAISFFTIAMGLMGIYYAGMRLTPIDMSPNYAGFLTAISNGTAAIAGITAPYLAGWMTPNGTLSEWRSVFWLAFAVMVLCALVFVVWGTGKVQDYNEPLTMAEKKAERTKLAEEVKKKKAEEKLKKQEEKKLQKESKVK